MSDSALISLAASNIRHVIERTIANFETYPYRLKLQNISTTISAVTTSHFCTPRRISIIDKFRELSSP